MLESDQSIFKLIAAYAINFHLSLLFSFSSFVLATEDTRESRENKGGLARELCLKHVTDLHCSHVQDL